MTRIIFLDIDGPVIGTPQCILNPSASFDRSPMNTCALGWLKHLCDRTGALIVTNSSHNYYNTVQTIDETTKIERTLKDDLIRHGLRHDMFHTEWRTKFYAPFFCDSEEMDLTRDRGYGIEEFKSRHPEIEKYVIFDDMNFTTDPNLIQVQFDSGITFQDTQKALFILNNETEEKSRII